MFCELLPDPRRLVIAVPCCGGKGDGPEPWRPAAGFRELGRPSPSPTSAGRDAGTALLAEIRPDFVRVAASLVRGMPGNPLNSRAMQAMIGTIGESGTKVIATGISSPAERAACLEAGCELGQGALFEERKRPDSACLAEAQPRADRRPPWMPFLSASKRVGQFEWVRRAGRHVGSGPSLEPTCRN